MAKKFLFLSLFILVFCSSPFCSAQEEKPLEVTYPDIPGITDRPVDIKTPLPDYIKYLFNFAIFLSGLIIFGSMVYAGFSIVSSPGNPAKLTEGRSRLVSGITGLVILLGSYIILTTINPELVIIGASKKIPITNGLVLFKGPGCDLNQGSQSVLQTYPKLDSIQSAQSLQFGANPGELEAVLYSEINFKGTSVIISSDVQICYNIGWEAKSISLSWKVPGVYLCSEILDTSNGTRCPPTAIERYYSEAGDTAILDPGLNNNVKGVRIQDAVGSVNYDNYYDSFCVSHACLPGYPRLVDGKWLYKYTSNQYGAVLHEFDGWQGKCDLVTETTQDLSTDHDYSFDGLVLTYPTSAIHVYAEGPANGDGVWLCRVPNPSSENLKDSSKCLHFTQASENNNLDPSGWNDQISSVKIGGRYLVILYGAANYSGNECYATKQSNLNLEGTDIFRCGCFMGLFECHSCISSFKIIPIK